MDHFMEEKVTKNKGASHTKKIFKKLSSIYAL